jgi:hypothetical protein
MDWWSFATLSSIRGLPHAGVGDDPMISHFRAIGGVSERTDFEGF